MKALKNLIGGLAGAVALNILHETARRIYHKAPRVELVGEEAVSKLAQKAGVNAPTGNNLYLTTLAGDLLSNTLYYAMLGLGNTKKLVLRGAGHGFVAGIGALTLTKPMGLSDAPVTRTIETKILTVAWYTVGGIAAAAVIKALRK